VSAPCERAISDHIDAFWKCTLQTNALVLKGSDHEWTLILPAHTDHTVELEAWIQTEYALFSNKRFQREVPSLTIASGGVYSISDLHSVIQATEVSNHKFPDTVSTRAPVSREDSGTPCPV